VNYYTGENTGDKSFLSRKHNFAKMSVKSQPEEAEGVAYQKSSNRSRPSFGFYGVVSLLAKTKEDIYAQRRDIPAHWTSDR
jgi:hypothetical protein